MWFSSLDKKFEKFLEFARTRSCMMSLLLGYIYLIYQREFISTNADVYKIGNTLDLDKRKRNYPKGSIYLFTRATSNYQQIESEIKAEFCKKYLQRRDLGTEYFEGSHHEMIDDINIIIKKYNTYRKDVSQDKFNTKIKKTLHHFYEESLIYIHDSSGISSRMLHQYYIDYWLKNNSVDIALHNFNEFIDKISRIIGKPVGDIFIGQNWSENVDYNFELAKPVEQIQAPLLIKYFVKKSKNNSQHNIITISATDFLNDFKNFVKKNEYIADYKMSSMKFGLEIKKYFSDCNGFIDKDRVKHGTIYNYSINNMNNWLTKNGWISSYSD